VNDPRRELLCRGCGKPILGLQGEQLEEEGQYYCPRCLIALAESYIEEPPLEKSWWRLLRETRAWMVTMYLVTAVSLGVVVYQFPSFLASWRELPPVRSGGIYATDTKTDKCIDNLWRSIQEWQQRKKGAGAPPVCPASGRPYVVVPGTDPEIHCPDPGRHGFRDIVASTRRPVPELKR
jgi:hypothetical protein